MKRGSLHQPRRLIPSAIATHHEWDAADGYRWTLDAAADSDVRRIWSRYPDVMAQDPFPGGGPSSPGVRVAIMSELFKRAISRSAESARGTPPQAAAKGA